MQVLGIVCSPRRGGNTEILVREALKAVEQAGGETRLTLLSQMDIQPCDACGACRETNECVITDDMQKIYEYLLTADGVIFGTPVYFINVSAQAKAVIDRTYAFLHGGRLRGKVAAGLVAVRRVGGGQVLGPLYSYFTAQRMIIAGGGIGYGREKGDVNTGTGGSPVFTALQEAQALGKRVVWMIERMRPGSSA